MTDTNSNRPKSAPSHRLFNVTGDGDKARWINIGAAWPTKDSKGFTFVLSAIPVNGRIVMRIVEDKPVKKKGS